MNRIGYEQRKDIYRKAIERFGTIHQVIIAIEEMSELTKELCKVYRGEGTDNEKIAGELADVTIVLEQLRLIFDINDMVCDAMDFKMERLVERIAETEAEAEAPKSEIEWKPVMSYRGMIEKHHPEAIDAGCMGGVTGCPEDYFDDAPSWCIEHREKTDWDSCRGCWDGVYQGEAWIK